MAATKETQLLTAGSKAYVHVTGFELWEIFTVITTILSLASGIMWVTNLQPKKNQNQYIWIEQNKNLVFNEFSTVEAASQEDLQALPPVELSNTCYKEIANVKLNNQTYKRKLESLELAQKRVDGVANAISGNVGDPEPATKFKTFTQSIQNYLVSQRGQADMEYLFAQDTLLLRQQASKICQSNPVDAKVYVQSFQDSVEAFIQKQYPGQREYEENLDKWLESVKKLSWVVEHKPFDKISWEQNLTSFSENYVAIFQPSLDLNESQMEVSPYDIQTEVKNLENWERSYLESNKNLMEKTIFIYP